MKITEHKTDWFKLVLPLAIIICISFGVWALLTLRTEGSRCVADPIGYGSRQLAKIQGSDLIGTISFFEGNKPVIYFSNNQNLSRDYAQSLNPKNFTFDKIG